MQGESVENIHCRKFKGNPHWAHQKAYGLHKEKGLKNKEDDLQKIPQLLKCEE